MSVYSVLRVWITKCHSLEMLLIHTGTGMLKIALSRILGIRLLSIKDLINIGSVSVMGYWIWKRIWAICTSAPKVFLIHIVVKISKNAKKKLTKSAQKIRSRLYGIKILRKKCDVTKDNNGREEGIRTLEGLHLTRVPGVLLQPLGHLST